MGFFDKLKRGLEEPPGEPRQGQEPKQKRSEKPKTRKIKIEPEFSKPPQVPAPKKEEPPSEGELAIDLYETEGEFIIQSTIAGVKAEDLDISIEDGMVTIRGERQKKIEESQEGKYYYQECYWGAFSRQVILPEEVDGSRVEASMKDGVLTLRIPKAKKIQKKKIAVKQEE